MSENKRFKIVKTDLGDCITDYSPKILQTSHFKVNRYFEDGLYLICDLLNELHEENQQLKYKNEIFSDELEQAKAVINKKWSEYLKKKDGVILND